MARATVETPSLESEPSIRERALDAARRVAHASHEAQFLTSRAADAVEDGVHAAKRAVKSARRRVEKLADLRDQAVYHVKRRPIQALGVAVGVGFVLGVAIGRIRGRRDETLTNSLG